VLKINPSELQDSEWGNLIFMKDSIALEGIKLIEKYENDCRRKFIFHKQNNIPFYYEYGKRVTEWLKLTLNGLSHDEHQSIGIDVGAFKGDFLKPFIEGEMIKKGILFEPNPKNFIQLKTTHSNAWYQLENKAVGGSPGYVDFGYGEDDSTGSILEPIGSTPKIDQKENTEIVCLDDYVAQNDIVDRVRLLKVDTQGYDLSVLKGAEKMIRRSQPIILVEMIYAPLYAGQCSPVDIIRWMDEAGYTLAGTFDEFLSGDGWLAWNDACFIPRSRIHRYNEPFQLTPPPKATKNSRTNLTKELSFRERLKKAFQ